MCLGHEMMPAWFSRLAPCHWVSRQIFRRERVDADENWLAASRYRPFIQQITSTQQQISLPH